MALKSFAESSYRKIAEAVMFCQCAPHDKECAKLQQWMYPQCLYAIKSSSGVSLPNCKTVVSACQKERVCKHLSKSYFHSCSVSNGKCNAGTHQMNGCRQAVIKLRGSAIDTLCDCDEGDGKCWVHRVQLIPLNPCLHRAREEYNSKNYMNNIANSSLLPDLMYSKSKQLSKDSKHSTPEDKLLSNQTHINTIYSANDTFLTLQTLNQTSNDYVFNNSLPTDAYQTQQPPPKEEGCKMRNFNGDWIDNFKGSIIRSYTDWIGRCSNWCECHGNDTMTCHELPCIPDGTCKHEENILSFGEKIYLEGRGACTCHSGAFICDTPLAIDRKLPPGLYILAGYSKDELKMFKEQIPLEILERSGLVSHNNDLAADIASRLQFALERVMPENTLCRIVLVDEFPTENIVVYQLQWHGVDKYGNDSISKWHVGKLEKQCSSYVVQVSRNYVLNKAERYQLVLSSVKQIRVIDLLDELPPIIAGKSPQATISIWFSIVSIFILFNLHEYLP
uniref:GDNF family receptor alpha-like n=1 Tax=Rhabditophanes sp. KR3021 TaxID=114890 RepID=A0AC35U661_9BILA